MNKTLKNIIAVVVGIISGGLINMGLIMISGSIIPPPDGADLTTAEGLRASMHLMQPKHFLLPFVAHALGTFFGAIVAVLIAASHKTRIAIGIGFFFMIGGIINVLTLPSPLWFSVLDLVVAYIPMGWLAAVVTRPKRINN